MKARLEAVVPTLVFILQVTYTSGVVAQDYDVSEIQCTFGGGGEGRQGKASKAIMGKDSISAKLRRPEGFKGAPLFADDRAADPQQDTECQIRPDPADSTGLSYNLLVTNFGRCGVLKRNGFVHVRVWFPQFPGVVMVSDQELIIMCKPPEPTIIENKAAGFAGSLPHGARVSGVVEETPGRLEYEVALYKEAPPRHPQSTTLPGTTTTHGTGELPVDQAVPIGTKLQLRARINPQSAWKHVKLMEVMVSPDPDDAHVEGSVALVKGGCRNRDFATIIPHQPARYRDRLNEVFLDFEAFLLSSAKERATLWIHSQIKACMDPADCQPEYCLDLFEPQGQGRRRRSIADNMHSTSSSTQPHNVTQYTKFRENIEYTVLMPGELYHSSSPSESPCPGLLLVSASLCCLLLLTAILVCHLASRLRTAVAAADNIDRLVHKHNHKHNMEYTGRSTMQ